MASPRRVGSEKSETRARLLDCVERLMLEKGYAAVSYRAVASKAGVTPGLVQYYFPTLDDLFVASIRRYTERNVARLVEALEANPDQVRRVLWDYSRDEFGAALTMEYMALGNHRESIADEIAEVTERVQRVQLEALKQQRERGGAAADEPAPEALLFLLTGVPKQLQFYGGFGLATGHEEVVALFERYLDRVEPRRGPSAGKSAGKSGGRRESAPRRRRGRSA